jgi:hypothetical protein
MRAAHVRAAHSGKLGTVDGAGAVGVDRLKHAQQVRLPHLPARQHCPSEYSDYPDRSLDRSLGPANTARAFLFANPLAHAGPTLHTRKRAHAVALEGGVAIGASARTQPTLSHKTGRHLVPGARVRCYPVLMHARARTHLAHRADFGA